MSCAAPNLITIETRFLIKRMGSTDEAKKPGFKESYTFE